MGKDILITPGDALINFSGASAGNINLEVQDDGRVSFIGISTGAEQLTISDSLSGSVFTVNNVGGSPIIDINFDNTITVPYGASDGYVWTSNSGGTATWQAVGGASSATCLSELWVSSISGCSPVTIGTPAIFNQSVNINGGLTANTVSATTYYGDGSNLTNLTPNVVEVTQSSDLPSILATNTNYIVNGAVTTSNSITATTGSSLIGRDQHKDILTYNGIDTFLTVRDVDFTIANITLSAPYGKILDATNLTLDDSSNKWGRINILNITNAQIRNTNDVMSITGFELVDLNNVLMWFVTGSTGCEFQATRHLEMSSCEVFNWSHEENPATSGYSISSMIDLKENAQGIGLEAGNEVGFAVVNMNGNIIHPEQYQTGLTINSNSTTIFGTIASNTFINHGLNPTGGTLASINYDIQNTYIIQANQGLQSGNAKSSMQLFDNANRLQTFTSDPNFANPIIFKSTNVIGNVFTTPLTFPISQRMSGNTTGCSMTYDSAIDGNFFLSVNTNLLHIKNVNKDVLFTLQLRKNGVDVAGGYTEAQLKENVEFPLSYSILTSTVQGDLYDFEMSVRDDKTYVLDDDEPVIVINFVVNAYQF